MLDPNGSHVDVDAKPAGASIAPLDAGAPPAGGSMIPSTSDARTVNNPMRHQYRFLSDKEKADMLAIKDAGAALYDLISGLPGSRETSLAKTKVEESVMWAVKSLTS